MCASARSATSRARIATRIEGFAAELLPVRDGLELGVRNGARPPTPRTPAGWPGSHAEAARSGVRASSPIKQLDPAGQRFDPSRHEAVLMQRVGRGAPNTVLQVVQPGYELNGRLLRPARVIVAAGTSAGSWAGRK